MSYALYGAVGTVLALASLPFLPVLALTRSGRGLGERLGRLPAAVRRLERPVWIHAASVGEVLAAEPLLRQLRHGFPTLPLLVTTTTVTGRATAARRLGADAVMLLPVDISWIIGRAVQQIRPRCLILVETEIWPALLRATARHAAPCIVVSGRISLRAARRYAWMQPLMARALRHVSAFAMQTDADAERLITLGAPPERVQVLGSLKYARAGGEPATVRGSALAIGPGRRVLIAASTHPGEEALVLDAGADLWREFDNLLLIIAPRRPERFEDVAAMLTRSGRHTARRSQLPDDVPPHVAVLLLDSIGELLDFLPTATAVFVGGTIAPVGGHNVLEPAMFGKPVAFGPHIGNVAAAAQALLANRGGTLVHGAAELAAEWRRLLADPAAAVEMGARAAAVVAARAAVAERTFAVVQRFLETPR